MLHDADNDDEALAAALQASAMLHAADHNKDELAEALQNAEKEKRRISVMLEQAKSVLPFGDSLPAFPDVSRAKC